MRVELVTRGAWGVAALLAVLAVAAPVHALSIEGQIVSWDRGIPVEGVSVRLTGPSVRTSITGSDGRYHFANLVPGSWHLEPQKAGERRDSVSALDAARAYQNAEGMRGLSAVAGLGCDVDADGSVGAADGDTILALLVGNRTSLPAAESCGGDWLFVPIPAPLPGQTVAAPMLSAGLCIPGSIDLAALSTDVDRQDFLAVPIGDCTGNWRSDEPTPSPTSTFSPLPTSTWSHTPTTTPTATPTATATHTATSTSTATHTPTATPTVTWTSSRTPVPTWTPTPTATGTSTDTPLPTATPTCPTEILWEPGPAQVIDQHAAGSIWLTRVIRTASGWGVFWLQEEPENRGTANLRYAHLSPEGTVTHGPMFVLDVSIIAFRGRYYIAAWHTDHFGILTAEGDRLYYQSMSLDGELSGRRQVGPTLFTSSIYDQEADGDLEPYPDGFLGVIEGECAGHSCSYAFRLDADGVPTSSVYNLVDFDLTHEFYPRAAWDGNGFAALSIKDINISSGGPGTKYIRTSGGPGRRQKVVSSKQYQWDEFPDLAWNGHHFAALWTENPARSHQEPWQIHFATFQRNYSSSTEIDDAVLEVWPVKPGHRWTTQLHAFGADWLAQFSRGVSGANPAAVLQWLDDHANLLAEIVLSEAMTADALGSAVDPATETIAVAQGRNQNGTISVSFRTVPPPVCP